MPQWIDLNRCLILAEESNEGAAMAAMFSVPGASLTWTEALRAPCLVVLGEAGSGKTSELRAQAERIANEGRASFFLRVEALAQDGIAAALEGDPDAFERWKQDSSEGWFFLDSVDEAKLSGESLERAVRRLRELQGALTRCHVILSCRHSDWRKEDDEIVQELARRLVKVPAPEQAELASIQRPLRRWPASGNRTFLPVPSSVRILRLAPLTRDQVRVYAERKEHVTDVDGFIAALGRADLWGLATRPLDVEWLAGAWRRDGEFGSLKKMIRDDINEKLDEKRDPIRYPVVISADQRREGIERVALAMVMTGKEAVAIPGSTTEGSTGALDARTLLWDWSDTQISSLLRLAVFDPATYGRVRFHHRTVREYLAASCLDRLQRHSAEEHNLDRLLFASVESRNFVKPGFEAVVAWLALDNVSVLCKAIDIAPEHLMDLGDPSEFSLSTRRQVLRSYARRFEGRKRTQHHFDRAGLERFADETLAPEIRELLAPHVSDDLRQALLQMIERKKLASLADAALQVAQESEIPSFLRPQAIRAVVAAGTLDQKQVLARTMIARFAGERETVSELLELLIPDVLTVDQVVVLLGNTPPRPGFGDGYSRVLERVATAYPVAMRSDFLAKLVKLFEHLVEEKGTDVGKHLEWAPLVIILADEDLLQNNGASDVVPSCFRIFQEVRRSDTFLRSNLDQLLVNKLSLRRAGFWCAIERWRNSHNAKWPRRAHEAWPHQWFQHTRADADWLENDVLTHHDIRGRLLAFDGLLSVLNNWRSEGPDQERAHCVANKRPEIKKHLERAISPYIHHKESSDMNRYNREWICRERQSKREHRSSHDSLRRATAQIRSGDNLNALTHLYIVGHKSDHEWSGLDVENTYDLELAKAAAEGFRHIWLKHEPPALHEVEDNGTPYLCAMGALGLDFNVREGLDVTLLKEPQLRTALTYAGWRSSGFPAWFDDLAARAPSLTQDVLGPSLRLNYKDTHTWRTIARLATAPERVRNACAPTMIDLLRTGDPANNEMLVDVLASLRGLPAHVENVRALCSSRCTQSIGMSARFAVWWKTWLALDANSAVDFLDHEVSASETCERADACVLACLTDRRSEEILVPLENEAAILLKLWGVVFRHVRPEEDIDDYHSSRHDAQEFRWRLLNAIVQTGAYESIHALDIAARLATTVAWRDRFERAAMDCAAQSVTKLRLLEDVAYFIKRGLLMPRTPDELFDVVRETLAAIQHHVERGDSSPRAVYCREETDEADIQLFFRRELEQRSNSRYIVAREDEITDRGRPDLRVWAPGLGPVSIEIKIADAPHWSLSNLEDAIKHQLVEQYMKDASAAYGLFLLVSVRKRRSWGEGGSRIERFGELVSHLKAKAYTLRDECPEIRGLDVLGVDFHEAPGLKRIPRSKSKPVT